MRITKFVLLATVAFVVEAQEFKPYPRAHITVEQWQAYFDEVSTKYASSRRDFASEHLVVFEASDSLTTYAFTQPGHPAHPAWVTRQPVQDNVGVQIRQIGYFAGEEAPFAQMFRQYQQLNAQLREDFKGRSSGATPAPNARTDVSVREVQTGKYEFVLTNPTVLNEREAMAQIAKAAASICKDTTPLLGRYRYEAKEAIGSGDPSSRESNTFRFVQEVSCVPGAQMQTDERQPTLKNDEDSRRVQNEVKLKSEAYFQLLASKRIEDAFAQVTVAGTGVNEATWKNDKLAFQAMAGELLEISIRKVTVYDNPGEAPEPGLYVAADYTNVYRDVPIYCGYLMWFRPVGGEFRITREEMGYVTSQQLKSIPSARLPEIKKKLRCLAP